MSRSENFEFTDDELDTLSEEEKEALGINLDADNGGLDLLDDDEEETETSETKQDSTPIEQTQEAVEVESPQYETAQQPDLVTQYNTVNSEIEKLGVEMEDGDISFAEYNKRLNELIGYKTRLEILYEQQTQAQNQAANAWDSAQEKFFNDPVNAQIKEKPLLYGALSNAVSEIANSNDASGKSYDWILQQAKARVESELGVKLGGAKQALAQQSQRKALDTVNLPKTLGNIPAAQANDSNNEFAYLDRLSSTDRESALAKMTPEQVNRYLESE